ncbi:MAG: alpha/beta hydrolase [Planctomycetota bacterium]
MAQVTSKTNQQLRQALERYPQADTNRDGVLTLQEARAFQQNARSRNANRQAPREPKAPAPTHADVRYGPYDRNVFDLWLPESDKPTALIVYIHGGGFVGGSKDKANKTHVQQALDRGVAFASIQYRFIHRTSDLSDPQRAGIQDVLRDSARAVQFMRSKADEYNLDKRVIAYGGSAGAGTSIWLAFHDDLADPDNPDPVLRESSRLTAAGMLSGQFTYDVSQWDERIEGGDIQKTHGDGSDERDFGRFFAIDSATYEGAVGRKWRADVDMYNLVSPDDPPVFALTPGADRPPTTRGIYNHHPRHATLIEERCIQQGVEVLCLVPKVRPADQAKLDANPNLMMDFFFDKLGLVTGQ